MRCKAGTNLGFMFLPNYRAWVIAFSLVVCFVTWFAIERHPARLVSCARRRKIRRWFAPSASMCRAW